MGTDSKCSILDEVVALSKVAYDMVLMLNYCGSEKNEN